MKNSATMIVTAMVMLSIPERSLTRCRRVEHDRYAFSGPGDRAVDQEVAERENRSGSGRE